MKDDKGVLIAIVGMLMFLCGIFLNFIYFFSFADDYRVLFLTSDMVRSVYFAFFIIYNIFLLWMIIKYSTIKKHIVFFISGIIMFLLSIIWNLGYLLLYCDEFRHEYYISHVEKYTNNFIFIVVYNIFTIGLFIAYIKYNDEKSVLSKIIIMFTLMFLVVIICSYRYRKNEVNERKKIINIYEGYGESDKEAYYTFQYNGLFNVSERESALEPYCYLVSENKYSMASISIGIEGYDSAITEDLEKINNERQAEKKAKIDLEDCIKVNDKVMRTEFFEIDFGGHKCYVIDADSKRYVEFFFYDDTYENIVLEMIETVVFY